MTCEYNPKIPVGLTGISHHSASDVQQFSALLKAAMRRLSLWCLPGPLLFILPCHYIFDCCESGHPFKRGLSDPGGQGFLHLLMFAILDGGIAP